MTKRSNDAYSRRGFLKTLAGASAAGLFAFETKAQNPEPNGHNVLLLMSDEHSPHAVGFLGSKIAQTPALDSLARRGVAFSAAYCQDPVCVPSRVSILTGRMPSKVGVIDNGGGLDDTVPTLADVFKGAGYSAYWLGKTHWGGKPDFDDFESRPDVKELIAQRQSGLKRKASKSRLPEDAEIVDYPASIEPDSITKDLALKCLEENKDRRFFLGVSFRKPHFPFSVQAEFAEPFKGKLDAPRVSPEAIEALPRVSRNERDKYGFANLRDEQIVKAREIYYGMVRYVDGLIGEILAKLDELGLRENTIVLYTSDHGELAGEHGLWYKNSYYEASVRVPHVWSFPKVLPQGATVSTPTMNMDILPTLCDLCGLDKPEGLEGASLLPLMLGQEDGKDRVAFSENFRGGMPSRMIRTDRWKYCYYVDDIEQLFDMREDPEETVNLVDRPEHRELVAALKAQALEGWDYKAYLARKRELAKAGALSSEGEE